MHRAEKVSSKLCRDREVEKAQELHRKKIEGVKSYLMGITRPPQPSLRSSNTFFRRQQRPQQEHNGKGYGDVIHPKPTRSLADSTAATINPSEDNDMSSPSDNEPGDDDGSYATGDEGFDSPPESGPKASQREVKTFDKLDEFRSVMAPVMAYGMALEDDNDYENKDHEDTSPSKNSVKSHGRSLHGAFRMRRLKQIQTDNVTIFERIKNSSAHYRNDNLKREWEQNKAYLTSICEYPVLPDAQHPSPCAGRGNVKPPWLLMRKKTPVRPELPSLDHPPVMHPIKVLPTSPTKTPLNLSPAFRSLRKGLPQQPSLPPLTPAAAAATLPITSPRPPNTVRTSGTGSVSELDHGWEPSDEKTESESEVPASSPSASTHFKRRLPSSNAVSKPVTAARYKLLKTGRFVGGIYLVLTVYCGDGITNPYGFDVVAENPAAQVEYKLSVTKETTHELLDAISSTSLAAVTAAAAGTNLSMELIAKRLCEHIQFAVIAQPGNTSEILFLVVNKRRKEDDQDESENEDQDKEHEKTDKASTTTKNDDDRCVMLDIPASAMTLCLHRRVSVPALHGHVANIFACTRPPRCCRASMSADRSTRKETPPSREEHSMIARSGLVCFQLQTEESSKGLHIECEVEIEEMRAAVDHLLLHQKITPFTDVQHVSLEVALLSALQYLHIDEDVNGHRSLRFDASMKNDWESRPNATEDEHSGRSLQHSRSRLSPHRISHSDWDPVEDVLQSGLIWRNVYFLVNVTLVGPSAAQQKHDVNEEQLLLQVFNSASRNHCERILRGDEVEAFSLRLGTWQREHTPPLLSFTLEILQHVTVEMDWRGHEKLFFPTLEPRYPNARRIPDAKTTKKHMGVYGQPTPPPDSCENQETTQVGMVEMMTLECEPSDTSHQYSVFLSSLSPAQQSMTMNHAARTIQHACQEWSVGHPKRRNASLVVDPLRTPRVLTPVIGRRTSDVLGLTHHDEDHSGSEDDDDDDGDDDDDDMEPGRHHGMVAALDSVQEEDDVDRKSSRAEISVVEAPESESPVDNPVESTASTSYRLGAKIDGHFVLQRRSTGSSTTDEPETIESHVISESPSAIEDIIP